MMLVMDSFWRAALQCLHPRVIALSLLPLVLIVALSCLLGYWYWDLAVSGVRAWLDASSWLALVWRWLEAMGLPGLKTVVAPLVVIFSVTPLVVLACLLAVSFFMTPALARWVADRRFASLQRQSAGTWLGALWWTLSSVLLALGAVLLTLPMWWVPPLALLLPALIGGWLTYRVMAFDVLAEFASADERHTLMARHRTRLLGMGVFTGLLGAVPSLVWTSSAFWAVAFVILVPVAIWIYTWVFAFSSLWFAHFALAALQALRSQAGHATVDEVVPSAPASAHAAARLGAGPQHQAADVTDIASRPRT